MCEQTAGKVDELPCRLPLPPPAEHSVAGRSAPQAASSRSLRPCSDGASPTSRPGSSNLQGLPADVRKHVSLQFHNFPFRWFPTTLGQGSCELETTFGLISLREQAW